MILMSADELGNTQIQLSNDTNTNHNRSRGACGVWEIRELGSIIGRKARIEIIKTNR